MSILLLGRKCTSSSKFHDNLFDDNAVPPAVLEILGKLTGEQEEVWRHTYILNSSKRSRG